MNKLFTVGTQRFYSFSGAVLQIYCILCGLNTLNVHMASTTLHKVFVYGTLKRGEPNHSWFNKSTEGYQKFLYNAKTKDKFPLIIGTQYNIPFLLYAPGQGYNVKGEVYEVDDKVLENLDYLEDHPNYYIRELYDVQNIDSPGENSEKVWIYVIKKFKKELLSQPLLESYSNFDSHGREYVESEQEESSLDDLQ